MQWAAAEWVCDWCGLTGIEALPTHGVQVSRPVRLVLDENLRPQSASARRSRTQAQGALRHGGPSQRVQRRRTATGAELLPSAPIHRRAPGLFAPLTGLLPAQPPRRLAGHPRSAVRPAVDGFRRLRRAVLRARVPDQAGDGRRKLPLPVPLVLRRRLSDLFRQQDDPQMSIATTRRLSYRWRREKQHSEIANRPIYSWTIRPCFWPFGRKPQPHVHLQKAWRAPIF